ncbi:hypothetical protein [Clostridium botulinum]|uniref:hypothetical protein n=2 Tax=Clostridium botulinum TaxID=1491 RepID=UPI003DA5C1C0
MDTIGKIIKQYLMILVTFIIKNIDDILILEGCSVLTTAFFIYVSKFSGMIALSTILILIGLILSKLPKKDSN